MTERAIIGYPRCQLHHYRRARPRRLPAGAATVGALLALSHTTDGSVGFRQPMAGSPRPPDQSQSRDQEGTGANQKEACK